MTLRIVYAVLWLVLALTTLVLYLHGGHVLAALFTAWAGGMVTANLWHAVRARSAV